MAREEGDGGLNGDGFESGSHMLVAMMLQMFGRAMRIPHDTFASYWNATRTMRTVDGITHDSRTDDLDWWLARSETVLLASNVGVNR